MANKFKQLYEKFKSRFSKPARIGIYSAVIILVIGCITGVVMAANSSDNDTLSKAQSDTSSVVETAHTTASDKASESEQESIKEEITKEKTVFNNSLIAIDKDPSSQSARDEMAKNGEALLNSMQKLYDITTNADDRSVIESDMKDIKEKIDAHKEAAESSSQVDEKEPEATPETKKETTVKPKQNSGNAPGNTKKNTFSGNSNNSGSSKKACKTVNHPAKTHIVHHPAVTHEEPVYTTQQVQTGTRTVVDQPAYDETVRDGERVVCGACGQKFLTSREAENHLIDAHDGVGNYWVEAAYKTIHHDAVTHEEPVYTTQQVQTGTKTVIDQAAWDETVIDQPAYTTCE